MSRRGAYRKPLLVRVRELLTTEPAIWLSGFAVGVVVLVVTSVAGAVLGLILAIPLVLVATAAIDLKGRVMLVRRRILLTRRSTSRRQVLATMLAVLVVSALTGGLGWLVRGFILGSYDERLQRHMTRTPTKK